MEPIKLVLCRWVTSRLRPGQIQFLIWVIWRWRSPSQVKQFKRNEISVTVKLLTRPKYVNDSLIYQNCPILNKCICTDYRHYINSLNMLHKGINVINVIVSIFTSSQSTLSVSNCTSQTCVSSCVLIVASLVICSTMLYLNIHLLALLISTIIS